jgi:hypothetical protein
MSRKTGVWLTTSVLLLALLGISFIGLQDVSASNSKMSALQSSKQVVKSSTAAKLDVSATGNDLASSESETPKFSGISKTSTAPKPYANANLIEFSNGYTINTDIGEPEIPSELKYSTVKDDEFTYYIVQFNGPIQENWRKGLEKAGAEVMSYLPNYAFLVRMNETIRKNIAATKGEVKWTGLYQPAYKISPRLATQAKGGKIRATVMVFSPEDVSSSIKDIESVVGHKIFHKSVFEWAPGKFNKKIFVDISLDKLSALANIKGVSWIEPMPVFRTQNANSQVTIQAYGTVANYRPLWALGLAGEGQIVLDLDTGCRESQNFFKDNAHRHAYVNGISEWYWDINHSKVVGQQPGGRQDEIDLGWAAGTMSRYGDESANSYHGTHTSGSIVGNDSANSGTYAMDGMAKNAKLIFVDGGGDSGSVYGTYDINRVGSWGWDSAAKYLGGQKAYISSNSWGDSSANGVYDLSGMETDQFMWSHKDFLFLFSDDNDGTKTQPGSKAGSPAVNKNGVAVGALSAGTNPGGASTRATFSSWGRHADGRLNPTVTAPGTAILSANGGVDVGTLSMQGTSMSCPITAGATALIRQYFTEGWYPTGTKIAANGFTPSGALMKAMLAISGDSTTSYCASFYPDSMYGWGRVNLDTALYFSGNGVKLIVNDNRTGVMTGEVYEYLLTLPVGATGLKIGVNWTDYPGVPYASRTLVNDLDLDAYNPSAVRYRGNRFTSTVPRQTNTAATNNDSIDVMEGIRVTAPAAGTWRITVSGRNVAVGPQPFALVITYKTAVATYPAMGKVYMNKPVYSIPSTGGSNDTLNIEVIDPNNLTASSNVTVYAKLVETTSETVTCAKVGDGLFRGSIALYNGNPVNGDGRLSVDARDTVWVRYDDASPVASDSTYAIIDANTFTISNIYSYDPTPPNASVKYIHWTTSENTNSTIYYGTTTALGSALVLDTPYVFEHNIKMTGLTGSTLYYFDIESKDYRGNVVRDDNAGRHYTFSTGSSTGSDVLVVVFNTDLTSGDAFEFAHPDFLTNALNDGGWSYDWWTTDQGMFTTSKLKTYKAVFFQNGQENYPSLTPAIRETLKLYHDAGARFAVTGHDVGWDTWGNQVTGADLQADTLFCRNYLHFTYKGDVINELAFSPLYGISGDPISGSYTSGVPYQPFRNGACGDSIWGVAGAGTVSPVWDGPNAMDTCGIKWESNSTMGTSGNGVWGGQKTRVVFNGFEVTQFDTTNKTSASRTDILNKLFIWLIGHDHPDVLVSSPIAGATYTSSPITISWTSSAYGGATIDTTFLEYSDNEGSSWNLITKGTAISSPYSWSVSSINGTKYQVRVRVKDKGLYPSMSGSDTVGTFTINRTGGDNLGPVVMPGSIKFGRSPVGNTADSWITVQAIANDSTTGLSNIAAVKCSIRAGSNSYVFSLNAMDGAYDEVVEMVQNSLSTSGWTTGTATVCLRAQDNSPSKTPANWGPWIYTSVNVINGITTPKAVELSYFTFSVSSQGVALKWRTETENNSLEWQIQRSKSLVGPFETVSRMEAQGTTNEPHEYSFLDNKVDPNQTYYYQLVEVSTSGSQIFGPITVTTEALPISFALAYPRPNPFAGESKIYYQIPERSRVSLKIYNITGQMVSTLVNDVKAAGYYYATWNGKNDQGVTLPNGIYFYRLEAGNNKATRKITLIK